MAAAVLASRLRRPLFCAAAAAPSLLLRRSASSLRPPPPPPPTVSRYAFIKGLAAKPSPTVLYEAPSHLWFYLGCWTSGLSILSWTLLTGPTVIAQPAGTPAWVGLVFGASYAILGSMGFFILSKTPRIVGRIRVLPGAPALRLEITVKRMLPLLAPRTVSAPLDRVFLKTRFSLPPELVPELRRLEKEDEAARQAAALHRFDMQHLLTMPFRRLGRAVVGFFHGVRAAWTGMGYGIISVDGREYKVDVTGGYAHDGFHTLERIVRVGSKE